MVITDIQKIMAGAGLGITSVLAVVLLIYHAGAESGRFEVQTQFDTYKQAEAKQLDAAKNAISTAEFRHRQETATIEDQLRKTEATNEATVAALRSSYSDSLRASDTRAAAYRRMSASGPGQCDDLASHAAELDRSLVTGRSLVEELRSDIELREGQLRALGAVITNDRQLVGTH